MSAGQRDTKSTGQQHAARAHDGTDWEACESTSFQPMTFPGDRGCKRIRVPPRAPLLRFEIRGLDNLELLELQGLERYQPLQSLLYPQASQRQHAFTRISLTLPQRSQHS